LTSLRTQTKAPGRVARHTAETFAPIADQVSGPYTSIVWWVGRALLHDVGVSNLTIRPLTIRARRSEDLDRCVDVLREVRLANGYPMKWPSDPRAWLDRPELDQAWVAESSPGVIVGHVAVQNGREITRLFVAPAARRLKVASALLDHVSVWAGGRMILNVIDDPGSPAVAFYEGTGWRYTHTTTADWTGARGEAVRLRHYVR
jgi:GNAT superfamily N-acetyltransferase